MPPTLPSWITDCSKVLRVTNVFPGATVKLSDYANSKVIASVASADSIVDLPVNTLTKGQQVTVRQDHPAIGGYDSPPVTVAGTPPIPLPPVALTPVHRCGRCVMLGGMSAGHIAKVYVNATAVGSAVAMGPTVQVNLSIGAQGTISFSAENCNVQVPSSTSLPYAAVAVPTLPAPSVRGPLYECGTQITIDNVVSGSILTLFRTNQQAISFCAPGPGRVRVAPLKSGQVVWAAARMDPCEGRRSLSSPFSEQAKVEDARPPTPMVIPPCPRGMALYIAKLVPGAKVSVRVGDKEFWTYASETSLVFYPPDEKTFVQGEHVFVSQELCGSKLSTPIADVIVRHGAQVALPLAFPYPLIAGASIVRVENAAVWGALTIESKMYGPLATVAPTAASVVDVVVPSLVRDDVITATFGLCGQTTTMNGTVVQKEPTPPKIVSATCDGRVLVGNVLPGSTVYLLVNDVPQPASQTATDTAEFVVQGLVGGDVVTARYVIGGLLSAIAKATVTATPGGVWTILPKTFEVPGDPEHSFLPVHAALLADPLDAMNYRVLFFAGSGYDERWHLYGEQEKATDTWPPHWNSTRMWYPTAGGTIGFVGNGLTYDAFCAGQCLLGDGSVLVVGGSKYYPSEVTSSLHHAAIHFAGVRDCARFDPVTLLWDWAPNLNGDADLRTGGRWYPTVVTLPDGSALTAGGHPDEGQLVNHTNNTAEHWVPSSGAWVETTNRVFSEDLARDSNPQFYPQLFVLPSISPTRQRMLVIGLGSEKEMVAWLSSAQLGTLQSEDSADVDHLPYSHGTAVLLPLRAAASWDARVLAIGASGTATKPKKPQLVALYELGDRSAKNGTIKPDVADPVRADRWFGMATLLPDGTLLYQGGTGNPDDHTTAIADAGIFDPTTETWTAVSQSTVPRSYHSVSLLLPDGRVLVGGSNFERKASYNHLADPNRQTTPDPNNPSDWTQFETREFRIETYSPPYMCIYPRPQIQWSGPPPQVTYGDPFVVPTPDGKVVRAVTMLRHGTSTHAFDPDQRCIFPAFVASGAGVEVTLPPDGTVATPGYYTMYLLGMNGSVSLPGLTVRLG